MIETSPASSERSSEEGTNSAQDQETADLVFILDSAGVLLYVSRALPKVDADEAVGTSVFEYLHPAHHDQVRSALTEVFGKAQAVTFEFQGMAHLHSSHWYDGRLVATTRDGAVVSATLIARDITSRKAVENDLRSELESSKAELDELRRRLDQGIRESDVVVESEPVVPPPTPVHTLVERAAQVAEAAQEPDRFRAILDAAGEAIFISEADTGAIVDLNETACRWLSQTRHEVLTDPLQDYMLQFPLQVPDADADHVTETRLETRARMFNGEHRRGNGSTFPVEVAITSHEFAGRHYVLAVARDAKSRQVMVDALRESEEHYRALFELSSDAIYLTKRDGSIARVNPAASDVFGYSPEEFLMLNASKLYVERDDIRKFQQTIQKEGFVRELPLEFARNDGSTFRGLLTATLRYAGEGNVLGYQCVIRPVVPKAPSGPPTREGFNADTRVRRDVVLLVSAARQVRSDVKQVLELTGVRVLHSESLNDGLVIFRARHDEIGVLVLDAACDDVTDSQAFTEIRRLRPGARVVLLADDDQEQTIVEHFAAAGLAGIVRKPFHPLGLIQEVRNALAAVADSVSGRRLWGRSQAGSESH